MWCKKPSLYKPKKDIDFVIVLSLTVGILLLFVYVPIFYLAIFVSHDRGYAFISFIIAIATCVYSIAALIQCYKQRDIWEPVIDFKFIDRGEYSKLEFRIPKVIRPFVICSIKASPRDVFYGDMGVKRTMYKSIPFIKDERDIVTHNLILPPLKKCVRTEGVLKINVYTTLRIRPFHYYVPVEAPRSIIESREGLTH